MKRAFVWRFFLDNCVQIWAGKLKDCFLWIDSFKSVYSEVSSFHFGSMSPFARKTFSTKSLLNLDDTSHDLP